MSTFLEKLEVAESSLGDQAAKIGRGQEIVRNTIVRLREQDNELREIDELGFPEIGRVVREALIAFLESLVGSREVQVATSPVSVNGTQSAPPEAGDPQPPAPVARQARRKRSRHTDAWGITIPIVRKALCGEPPPPQNLDEALERAYGSEWGSRTITMTNGTREGDGMTRRMYVDDVGDPESIIKRGIKQTILCCLRYAEGGEAAFPANRPVGPNVKKLTPELGLPRKKEEILGVLLAWGIQVEEPVAAG